MPDKEVQYLSIKSSAKNKEKMQGWGGGNNQRKNFIHRNEGYKGLVPGTIVENNIHQNAGDKKKILKGSRIQDFIKDKKQVKCKRTHLPRYLLLKHTF